MQQQTCGGYRAWPHHRLDPFELRGCLGLALGLGVGAALALADLQPAGQRLILHAHQERELGAAPSAPLELIEYPLPLLGGVMYPAQDIGLYEYRLRCGSPNQALRSFHTGTYYDAYDPN